MKILRIEAGSRLRGVRPPPAILQNVDPAADNTASLGEKSIPEALYDCLSSPSLFGRLLLVSGCRTTGTDQYDAGPAECFFTPAIGRALRDLHLNLFRSWLTLSQKRQASDCTIYVNARPPAVRSTVITQLLVSTEHMTPCAATPVERQLFKEDLKMVQLLLRYDHKFAFAS